MCDQSDPNTDYNSEEYMSMISTKEYELEIILFKQGVNYFLAHLRNTDRTEESVNSVIFDAARASNLDMKLFFRRIYNTLFRQQSGPKLATFILLLGIDEFINLLSDRIKYPVCFRTTY